MILILSSSGDYSVNLVCDWLAHYGHKFIRINPSDIFDRNFRIIMESGKEPMVYIDDKSFDFDSIKAVWLRKFFFVNTTEWWTTYLREKTVNITSVLARQSRRILDFFTFCLKDKNWLTHYGSVPLNKLEVLSYAIKAGLDIPETIVTNYREAALDVGDYITKSISDVSFLKHKGNDYLNYTSKVDKTDIPSNFGMSLLQKEIQKDFEIRIFYLMGETFPMGIFSQQDEQTKTDFRRYNLKCPNRMVPISIPDFLNKRIDLLMQSLNLNTGSLDFIKGQDGKYYFLEVNPTGQFGMVDFPCNYHLHRKVAQCLISMDK